MSSGVMKNMTRRQALGSALKLAGGVTLSGLVVSMARPLTAEAAAPNNVHLYMSILTGKMNGKAGWPEFVPANFTVPANTLLRVQIRCFDDGPAPLAADSYSKVAGTEGGTITVIKALNGMVDKTQGKTVTEIPADGVAHTLTIIGQNSKNLLNVPLPPLSTVKFAFRTPGAGSYYWQCFAACGTGESGWGGPMVTQGWMKGIMTVAAGELGC